MTSTARNLFHFEIFKSFDQRWFVHRFIFRCHFKAALTVGIITPQVRQTINYGLIRISAYISLYILYIISLIINNYHTCYGC